MAIRLAMVVSAAVTFVHTAPSALVYEGRWNTTNRRLDGTMTCLVTPLAGDEWRGRFSGTWQGVPFDYKVTFHGPETDLRGTATIDGAKYEWRALMTPSRFKANFSGDRYVGSFDLQRKLTDVSAAAPSDKYPSRAAARSPGHARADIQVR